MPAGVPFRADLRLAGNDEFRFWRPFRLPVFHAFGAEPCIQGRLPWFRASKLERYDWPAAEWGPLGYPAACCFFGSPIWHHASRICLHTLRPDATVRLARSQPPT